MQKVLEYDYHEMNNMFNVFCEICFIDGGHCSWITRILPVEWDEFGV